MTLFRHRATGSLIGAETWQIGLYTQGTATVAAAEATWTTAVKSLFGADMLALYSASTTVDSTSTATIEESTGAQLLREDTPVSLSGSSPSETLPPQIALVVTLKSAAATKRSNGRFYLPSPSIDALSGGRVSSAAQATIKAAGDDMWAQLNTGGLQLSLYSQTFNVVQAITRGSVGDVWDTQRRRRDKLTETRVALTPPS